MAATTTLSRELEWAGLLRGEETTDIDSDVRIGYIGREPAKQHALTEVKNPTNEKGEENRREEVKKKKS